MVALSGYFSVPIATAAVPYAAGGAVTLTLRGEFPKAIINSEYSEDAGATWKPVWCAFGIEGSSFAPGSRSH